MIAFVTCPIIGLLVLMSALRGADRRERVLLTIGFVAHVIGSLAIVAYHDFVGGGDMLGYAFYGRQLEAVMSADFGGYVPEVIKLALHLDNSLPAVRSYDTSFAEVLYGTGTTTMFALAGLVMMVVGTSVFAAALMFGFYAYAGTAYFYKAVKESLLEDERLPFCYALLFVPSVVFWSSGIEKEASVLGSLGLLCGGILEAARRRPRGFLIGALGATGIAVVKPYVFFPLALAVAAWLDARRGRAHSWAQRIGAVVVALAALVVLSMFFPQFAFDHLAATMADQQASTGVYVDAGSYVNIGAPETRTLGGQARFVPLALINALLRPVIVEAKNASMILAGLETAVVLVLVVILFRRHGVVGLVRRVRARPPLLAATVFTLAFGVGVGLTTTNLGTLSRYRLPMMPAYAAILFVLTRAKRDAPSAALAVTKPPALPPALARAVARRREERGAP